MKPSPCSSAPTTSTSRADAAIAQLAGPRFEPIEPMQVMGGGGTGSTVFDRLDLDRHTWRLAWPDNYFVPGNSTERWLGLLDCPPGAALCQRLGKRLPEPGDPLTGRVFSWAQPPRGRCEQRRDVRRGVRLLPPDRRAVRGAPRSGDRLDISISLLRRLGLGPEPGDFGAARWGAGASRPGSGTRHRRPGSERRMDRPAPWCRRPAR